MASGAGKLILLHGWLGDVADFEAMRPELANLVTLPLPGHGGSTLEADSTTASELRNLADRINAAAGGSPFALGGYSMGGRLALWLTAEKLVDPRALVLIAASPGLAAAEEREERLAHDRRLAEELRAGDFREFLDRWYRQELFGALTERADFEMLIHRRLQRDRKQAARALELFGVGRQPDLNRYPFRQAVLYIAGEQDRKYSAIAAGWKEVETALVPEAGHAVHLERPDEVSRLIQEMENRA